MDDTKYNVVQLHYTIFLQYGDALYIPLRLFIPVKCTEIHVVIFIW